LSAIPTTSHTFVVPAFGEPKWIERCLDSIQNQTLPSSVVITTPTPNPFIASVAERRRVPLIVNPVSRGIAADWNFALARGGSGWISIAHQDDWYDRRYVELCLEYARSARGALLVFTDATETLEGHSRDVLNVRMKRLLSSLAFLRSTAIESTFRRRLLLAFGNPIPCASVMINRAELPDFRFPEGWKSNLDWSAWVSLAKIPGAFVRVPQPLVHRTLHSAAATTQSLADRAAEDDRMFRQLWPSPIAAGLSRLYAASRRPYTRFGELR
jgi:glycosyltransferase involved in cell wall biosynthesis